MSLHVLNLRMPKQRRRGFTLMEMLIVIAIMLLLVIATLPRIKQTMDDSKLRESSRQLSSYFAMAKARAAATGRPCGVWFVSEQLGDPAGVPPNATFQSSQMYLAEVPAPYSGDVLESKVVVTDTNGNQLASAANGPAWRLNFIPAANSLTTLVQPGESFLIRFDHKGPIFNGTRNLNDGFFYVTGGPTVPPTANGLYDANTNPNAGYQYEIVRNAQRIGAPLNLPRGTSIDLAYSGMGNFGVDFFAAQTSFNNNGFPAAPAVLVLFTPEGRVGNVTYRSWDFSNSQYVTISNDAQGTIHFLVGRPEKVGLGLPQSNLVDNNALWVSVGRLTGSVTTTENAPNIDFVFSNPPTQQEQRNYLTIAREFAITQDVKGGQ